MNYKKYSIRWLIAKNEAEFKKESVGYLENLISETQNVIKEIEANFGG